ncbi:MAG TPA: hypothetical protein VGD17_20240 [Chitinophagaceae bacterium]
MMQKTTIANVILTIAVLYIISPYMFEKYFFFNELLSAIGFTLLLYKRFRIGNDPISIAMVLLITWCGVHAITSLIRMDTFYFYLRNSVIMYSMMTFFIGFFLLRYLGLYINRIRAALRVFIGIFLVIPLPRLFFERFGVAMLFPMLFKNAAARWVGFLLIMLNLVYAITYKSSTSGVAMLFFIFLFISPGYRFFSQTMGVAFLLFVLLFIHLHPYLTLISYNFAFYTDNPIYHVVGSHPLLGFDNNSTWRLVLWDQLIVDDFPGNIFGLGFGTPVLRYYPVEDYSKLHTLPYVLGGHNSYVYLFARLGIIYIALTVFIYAVVFKEYFYHKAYYFANNQILIFWSFFAVSIIALFNPALETPIYAGAYWLLLGFTARCIYNRRNAIQPNENFIHS